MGEEARLRERSGAWIRGFSDNLPIMLAIVAIDVRGTDIVVLV